MPIQRAGLAALLAILLGLLAFLPLGSSRAGAAPAQKPNVLILLMDDQTVDGFQKMPFLKSVMPQMRRFTNFYFTGPLCCPSRASLLTGMYPHNTGVQSNEGTDGGWAAFVQNRNEPITWARYLRRSGYATAMQGKYFNGYFHNFTVPTGWTDWFASWAGPPQTLESIRATGTTDGYDFPMNDNGTLALFKGEANYATDVLTRRASDFIIRAAERRKPFANLLAVKCPHSPATPASKYLGSAADEYPAYEDNPNYDEADVSDKPMRYRGEPRLSAQEKADMVALYRKRIECSYSVDDGLKKLWRQLERRNLLTNTYIFVLSDNGWIYGHHRARVQKNLPYVEASRSTLFVYGPDVTPGVDGRLVANIDLMPTLMQIAGLQIPAHVDGRSLTPLFSGATYPWGRHTLAVEGLPEWSPGSGTRTPDPRVFRAFVARTMTGFYTYHVYDTDEREFYDLTTDPFQLENGHGALPIQRSTAMRAHLDALLGCSGEQCRILENRSAP